MKNLALVLVGSLALVSCGSSLLKLPGTNPNPNPGPGASGYPYNPDANSVEQHAKLIPYRGNWSWLAGSSDGQIYSGDASIFKTIIDPNKQLVNNGFGDYRWCNDLTCTPPLIENNIGSIATYPDGNGDLAAAMDINETGSFRWVFIDSDKKVGTLANLPYLNGYGYFTSLDGVRHKAYFVMVQTSTEPRSSTFPKPVAQGVQGLVQQSIAADVVQAMQNDVKANAASAETKANGPELDAIQAIYKKNKPL